MGPPRAQCRCRGRRRPTASKNQPRPHHGPAVAGTAPFVSCRVPFRFVGPDPVAGLAPTLFDLDISPLQLIYRRPGLRPRPPVERRGWRPGAISPILDRQNRQEWRRPVTAVTAEAPNIHVKRL